MKYSPKENKICRLVDVTTVTGLLFFEMYTDTCGFQAETWSSVHQREGQRLEDTAFPVAAVLPETKTYTN